MATFTESFDQPDGSALGPDLTWTEVAGEWETIGGQAAMGQRSVNSYARAEVDTGSADMYVQVVIPAASRFATHYTDHQILVRMGATAYTGYALLRGYQNGPGEFVALRRYVDGQESQVAAPIALPLALPETWRVEVEGSTITAYRDGVEVISATDATITTGSRAGLGGYRNSTNDASQLLRFDSFETGALGAAPDPPGQGAAAGQATWTGVATGAAPTIPERDGMATGTTAWSGVATGTAPALPERTGTAAGATAWVGVAEGVRSPIGSGAGTTGWLGTATGHAPAMDSATGTATGGTTWTGAASGITDRTAVATGTLAWTGTATGQAPDLDARTGSASGTSTWAGMATGQRHPKAAAAGAVAWAGQAHGATTRAGAAAGAVAWSGAAVGRGTGGSDRRDIELRLGPLTPNPARLGTLHANPARVTDLRAHPLTLGPLRRTP